ncbi:hypothetical protein CKF58_01110 [Psittacicella hinzii]|uniref:Uncharacterized protein n=1 Tax=Psittacicella hinzii TaxID=2028575 RepID=A0A3A1YPP8_9GAMM|nr:hypothetical protein CKF58_01110 [Psittacicella hinzii]
MGYLVFSACFLYLVFFRGKKRRKQLIQARLRQRFARVEATYQSTSLKARANSSWTQFDSNKHKDTFSNEQLSLSEQKYNKERRPYLEQKSYEEQKSLVNNRYRDKFVQNLKSETSISTKRLAKTKRRSALEREIDYLERQEQVILAKQTATQNTLCKSSNEDD